MNAMIKILDRYEVNSNILRASWFNNLNSRKNWDWANSPSAVTYTSDSPSGLTRDGADLA